MVINPTLGFAFIEIPRTASTNMRNVLSRLPGSRKLRRHSRRPPQGCKELPRIACVRNPYARLYSQFCRRAAKGKNKGKWNTFRDYVIWITRASTKGKLKQTQSKFLHHRDIEHLVRFEDLPHSFQQLPYLSSGCSLPKSNSVTRVGKWQDAYNQELADRVFAWAWKDFARYSYDRDSWKVGRTEGKGEANPNLSRADILKVKHQKLVELQLKGKPTPKQETRSQAREKLLVQPVPVTRIPPSLVRFSQHFSLVRGKRGASVGE
jgi:hypothetical protein